MEDDRIVDAVRRLIARRVAPFVSDPQASRAIAVALHGLDEHLHRVASSKQASGRREQIVALLARSVRIEGIGPAGGGDALGELAALTPSLAAMAWQGHGEARDILAEIARLEADWANRTPAPGTEASDDDPVIVKLHAMEGYFRDRRGLPAGSGIVSVRRLSGGFSRITYAVAFDGNERFVVRVAQPSGILDRLGAALPEEAPFLRLARDNGMPVAELYWLEEDETYLGQPFLVTSFVEGVNLGDTLKADAAVSPAIIRDIAQVLARLHAIPWREAVARMGPGFAAMAAVDSAGATRMLLARIEDYWQAANLAPSPTLAMLHDWLVRNVPENGLPPAITHGDIGFHNMLFRGNRLAALLDWEAVFISSPAKDLANVRPFMSAHVPWAEFLGWYREAGGVLPTEQELTYQSRLRLMMGALVSRVATDNMFAHATDPDPEFLFLGVPGSTFFMAEIAKECANG